MNVDTGVTLYVKTGLDKGVNLHVKKYKPYIKTQVNEHGVCVKNSILWIYIICILIPNTGNKIISINLKIKMAAKN